MKSSKDDHPATGSKIRQETTWLDPDDSCTPKVQTHVHEFEGSVKLAEFDEDVHNHRFAGISGEVIPIAGSHVHKINTRTDFFDHFHLINVFTGPAVFVDGDADKHVHFVTGMTTMVDGHMHEFQFAMLIQAPLLPEPEEQA